ncbi:MULTISPECIES: 2TM domain-containing protein [unclassified Flavobacterium]|jgi:ABC-type multidrug transport system fused ATPase/permease subunit|uniref:2TM domain-containing protein n=1 Tax=unclassified Flavobacterium TaxID=196869 RepID=UPI0025C7395B|nr:MULTISPECIES: 2TM domain-containing protein [unclassified Flavobacterium]
MEKEQHEQYEYARKRLNQKKELYFHFVLFLLGSLFLAIANHFLVFGYDSNWSIWVITVWFFLFILHFIKIYITDRFMNKNWEREQIDRLVAQQQKKIAQLQTQADEDSSIKPQ